MAKLFVGCLNLVLCERCKGLFASYQLFEVHVQNCDGDAFKSPAELFACERKLFLKAASRSDWMTNGESGLTSTNRFPVDTLCDSQSDHTNSLDRQEFSALSAGDRDDALDSSAVGSVFQPLCSDSFLEDKQQTGEVYPCRQTGEPGSSITHTSSIENDAFQTAGGECDGDNGSMLLAFLRRLQQGSVGVAETTDSLDDQLKKQHNLLPQYEQLALLHLPSAGTVWNTGQVCNNRIRNLSVSVDRQSVIHTSNSVNNFGGISRTESVTDTSEVTNSFTESGNTCGLLSTVTDSQVSPASIFEKQPERLNKKLNSLSAVEKRAKLEEMKQEILQHCSVINSAQDSEKDKTVYCCSLCKHSTGSVAFMHKHLQSHNGGALFRCDQCDFTAVRRSRLTEHQARHSRPRLLCQHCSATFLDVSSLNRHITAKHSLSPSLRCLHCDFTASDASSLKEHTRKHTGEMLSCDVEGCNFKTVYKRALRLHQKRHAADKKYACHLCSFKCIESHVLTRHLRTHQAIRPYQCSSCSYTGTTRYEVVRHLKNTHDQQKRYACDKCSFRTPYTASIVKHVLKHLGQAAAIYACPLCKLRSNSLERARKHLFKVHERDDLDIILLQDPIKINPADYLAKADTPTIDISESRTIDQVMAGQCANVEQESLSPPTSGGLDSGRIDPMKLSFHFQDIPPPPLHSGVSITRSSSIPDLFTFSGINTGHRSNSQSDLLTFSGINITRSNSMSDLVSFASSMCAESVEPVNMDVSLSDATTPSADVHGLSLGMGDGPDGSLSDGVRTGSPSGVVLAVQCSNCLALLMSEDDIESHNKACNGLVQMV